MTMDDAPLPPSPFSALLRSDAPEIAEPLPLDHNGPADWPFVPFPAAEIEGSIPGRFSRIARRYPDRPAVVAGGHRLTYTDLLAAMHKAAAAVAAVAAPGPVAVLLAHEPRFPAAILGVLAAGRGCVPLDAEHPAERNRMIAAHAGVGAIVSAGPLAGTARQLFGAGVPVVDLDATAGEAVPAAEPAPDDLAFIIYTSGSTGTPKGVWQDHRGVLHDVMECTGTEHLGADDRLALFFAPTVSSSLRVTLSTLLNGGALHLFEPRQVDPAALAKRIRRERITVFRSVPALFRHAAAALGPGERFDDIRLVLLGGDRVAWSDVDAVRRACRPQTPVLVCLGGTETWSLHTQWFVDDAVRGASPTLPVGRPMLPDRRVAIVDEDGAPVADGEAGELVVSSPYLARGYWREPDLTARAFGVDADEPAWRTFRTGDLGRRRPDGLIVFAGRKDQQIKLAGRRIEPGEIEAALCRCTGVRDAAVIVRRDGNGVPRAIVAYAELAPDGAGLRPRHLLWMVARQLPEAMVPAALVIVDALPRLPNMKVDRVGLARLDAERRATAAERTPLTDEIGRIFEDLTGTAGATPDDNLSSLGGNSLHAVEAVLIIEKRFGVQLPQGVFREAGSIRELAERIDRLRSGRRAEIVPGRAPTDAPASLDFGDFHSILLHSGVDPVASHRCKNELLAAHAAGRPPAGTASLADWSVALTILFIAGRFDVLEHAAPHLAAHDPQFAYPRGLAAFLARLPPPLAADTDAFSDDGSLDIQVVRRDSDTVIICFCDALQALGMPLAAAHRWFGRLPASIIYLRDFARAYFATGIRSLGPRPETIAALRTIVTSLGARRTLCYGSSAGVFGALRYGLDLDAEAVLALSGPVNLDPAFNKRLRWVRSSQGLAARSGAGGLDLRDLYARASRPPRALLISADADWDDRLQMSWMEGLPSVEVRTFPHGGHNVATELVKQGAYPDLLNWLVKRH